MVVLLWAAVSMSFTTGTATWLAVRYAQPNPSFVQAVLSELDFYNFLLAVYSRESNMNSYSPTWVSGGFSIFRTVSDLVPAGTKYSQWGFTLDVSARLIAFRLLDQRRESVIGFGTGVGFSLESIEKLVGSSTDLEDFGKVDFKHYNKVSLLNGLASLNFYIQIPVDFGGLSEAFYNLSYQFTFGVFGPFLPNFEPARTDGEFTKLNSGFVHTIGIRTAF